MILRGHKKGINVIRNHNNWLVTAGCDGVIKFWDLRTSLCVKTVEAHQEEITCLEVVGTFLMTK
jgi:WD40 repeat protein